jgi:hypothetical protein
LLDTIYKKQPDAEVSVVVFQEHLFFDPTTSQSFSKYFQRLSRTVDNEPNQAYLPLMQLNRRYDGVLGIDIIKAVLATDTVTITRNGNPYSYTDLTYKPNFTTNSYTNINGSFIAAKQALTAAANPAAQQFVIFLSDGDPQGSDQAGLTDTYFTRGDTMPTTFTVFFTPNATAPASLQTMTQNIRNNGYSATNPQSNLWTIQTTYDDLLRLFMQQIITNILIPGNPTRLVVNGSRSSTTYIDSTFAFGNVFPLADNPTRFSFAITYRYSDQNDHVVRDSTITTTFYVRRVSGATAPPSIALHCENQVGPGGDSIAVTATLRDTSGDGHLDRIDLTWTDTATLRQTMPMLADLIDTLWITALDGSHIALRAVAIVPDPANKTISIILAQNTGKALETGWQTAKVDFSDVPVGQDGRRLGVSRIVDGAGPVIESASYFKNLRSGADSLVVVFSEPVTWPSGAAAPADLFNYFRRDTLKTGAFSGIPSSDVRPQSQGATVIISNGFEPVGDIDSMQLKGLITQIADAAGNNPPANGRKAAVQYGGDEYKIAVVNNPFVPGKTPLPGPIRQFYANVLTRDPAALGTIVGIQTVRPLQPHADGTFGKVRLYDQLANLVRKDLALSQAAGVTAYGTFWNGRNENGRYVGSGTYLMVIDTKDIDGKTKTMRVKIGIQR